MSDLLARSEEQRLLRDTAARVFAAPAGLATALAESGLLALPFGEGAGGLHPDDSADWRDLAIAFAAKGQGFAVDTLLLQAVLGGGLLAETGHSEALVAAIMRGDARIAIALHEPRARNNVWHCATSAKPTATGWALDGSKTLVLGAQTATQLVVLARIADGREGLGLFLVAHETAGINSRHYALRDGSPASDFTLTDVQLDKAALLAGPDVAATVLAAVLARTQLCLAAEASGIMRAITTGAAAYAAERKQFGQAIGSFQVIQHRLAEMAIAADQAEALVAQVARTGDDHAAIAHAYRAIANMGMAAAKSAIQIHGGYGMTEDLPYGAALRRMMTIALLF